MNKRNQKILIGILIVSVSQYLTFLIDVYTLHTMLERIFVFSYFCIISSLIVCLRKRFLGSTGRKSCLVSALIALVIIGMTPNMFLPVEQEVTISLYADGQNAKATGAEVWLTDVSVDDETVVLANLEPAQQLNWTYSGSYDDFAYFPGQGATGNELRFSVVGQSVDLTFASNTWSGNVRIATSAGQNEMFDLYNEDPATDKLVYSFDATKSYAVLEQLLYGAGCLVVLTFLVSFLIQYLSKRERGRKQELKSSEDSGIQQRNSSVDLLRLFATFTVLSVHFFLNSGYYFYPMMGERMWIMTVVRSGLMICVPLFIMLTGYLMSGKTLTKTYFKGIVNTLAVYVLASLFCAAYDIVCLDMTYSVKAIAGKILNFTLAPYSWYIKMYIGLFLLIPFLNAGYKQIGAACGEKEGRVRKKYLLLILVFLTAMPSVANAWGGTIVPDWWSNLYPVTYYLTGVYIREYGIKMKKRWALLFFSVCMVLLGVFCYWKCAGQLFIWGAWQHWNSFPIYIMASVVFVVGINISTQNWPSYVKKVLKRGSELCLGTYLVSSISDGIIYPKLNVMIQEMPLRFNYFIPVVLASFALAMVLSWIINAICNIGKRFW